RLRLLQLAVVLDHGSVLPVRSGSFAGSSTGPRTNASCALSRYGSATKSRLWGASPLRDLLRSPCLQPLSHRRPRRAAGRGAGWFWTDGEERCRSGGESSLSRGGRDHRGG